MESKNFKKEYKELIEKIKKIDEQIYICYPEYLTEENQGLDGGNYVLRQKLRENMKYFSSEYKKLKEKYGIKE